jgi:hypothetical protein
MPHRIDIRRIVRLLEKQRIVSRVEVVLVDEVERRGFYKLRASLIPSRYKLDNQLPRRKQRGMGTVFIWNIRRKRRGI